MVLLDKKIKQLKKLQKNLDFYVIDSIVKNKKSVIKLVKDQILVQGINGRGEKIRHAFKTYSIYSDGYEIYKRKIGKYTNKIDLTVNGDYLNSLFILKINKTSFVIDSEFTTSAGFDLADHNFNVYPFHLLLTKENRNLVSNLIVKPFLRKKINESLRI